MPALSKFVVSLLDSYECFELSARPRSYFYTIDIEQARDRLKRTNVQSVLPHLDGLEEKDVNGIAALLHIPGSSLPDFKVDEVEIARIDVSTMLGLAYSLRAEWNDQIRFRLVSEIDGLEFLLPITESREPLSLREVILQFEQASPAVGLKDLIQALQDGDNISLRAESAFYSGFKQFYEFASEKVIARFS